MARTVGRPRALIDLEELEKLAGLHCTYSEVAGWFGVTKQTIINRMKSDQEFIDAWERGQGKGKVSLRRLQWRIAEQGNSNMAIWLGKQHLGQRDFKMDDPSNENTAPLPWAD